MRARAAAFERLPPGPDTFAPPPPLLLARSGNIAPQPEVGFPGLCLQDSPTSVRFADLVSVFPAGTSCVVLVVLRRIAGMLRSGGGRLLRAAETDSAVRTGINAAATFDRKLMHARGVAMGQEFAAKGVQIALGPAIGIGVSCHRPLALQALPHPARADHHSAISTTTAQRSGRPQRQSLRSRVICSSRLHRPLTAPFCSQPPSHHSLTNSGSPSAQVRLSCRSPSAVRRLTTLCAATDPYLVGEGAYETVMGIQSTGVQANAKHFIGNEEEHNRTYSSSNIDDRTLHEVYLHPFLRAVQANVATVMVSPYCHRC